MSRYDVYRYEVANSSLIADLTVLSPGPPQKTERGTPACYTGGTGTLSDIPDRRIIQAAVINCLCLQAEDGSCYPNAPKLQGKGKDVPVAAFAKFFLTLPVKTTGSDPNVYAEMVDVLRAGDENSFYVVQLHR